MFPMIISDIFGETDTDLFLVRRQNQLSQQISAL